MNGANNFPAPEWHVDQWFNSSKPLSVAALHDRVIVLGAFQMLCPGCVSHGLPQLQKVAQLFNGLDVTVIGLHTVFEHHEAMTPVSLGAFLHEYRIGFPVGVDAKALNGNPLPRTMSAYDMRGTPTTILIDRAGVVRRHYFGQIDDLRLGADIMALLMNRNAIVETQGSVEAGLAGCDDQGCPIVGNA